MSKYYTLGRIPYLVCAPFFHNEVKESHFSYKSGSPAQCNRLLFDGFVQSAPSSSIEYAKNPGLYQISPHFCTASKDAIGSVILFSQKPFEEIQSVLLTQDSATSICLLDILFKKWRNQEAILVAERDSQPRLQGQTPQLQDAKLLIGDLALKESLNGQWKYQFDLASLWVKWTGLPFVFGLWIFRKDWSKATSDIEDTVENPCHDIQVDHKYWHQKLNQAVEDFETDPLGVFTRWSKSYPQTLSETQALDYFNKINYRLGTSEIEGLKLFYQYAFECGQIPAIPEIDFLKI